MSSTTDTHGGLHQRRSGYKNQGFKEDLQGGPPTSIRPPPWNRVIPEENLMTLGTLRFGIRVSNSFDGSSRGSSNASQGEDCCCPGTFSRPPSTKLPVATSLNGVGASGSKNRSTSLGVSSRAHPQSSHSLVPSSVRETSPNVCCLNSTKNLLLQQSAKLAQSCGTNGTSCCKGGHRIYQRAPAAHNANCDTRNSNNNNNSSKSGVVGVLGDDGVSEIEEDGKKPHKDNHKNKKLLISNGDDGQDGDRGVKNRPTIPTLVSEESNYNLSSSGASDCSADRPFALLNCFGGPRRVSTDPSVAENAHLLKKSSLPISTNGGSGGSGSDHVYIRTLIAPSSGAPAHILNHNNNSSNFNNKLPNSIGGGSNNKENKHKCNDSPLGPAKFMTACADTDFSYIDSSSCDTTSTQSDEVSPQPKRTFLHTIPTVYSPYLRSSNESNVALRNTDLIEFYEQKSPTALLRGCNKIKKRDEVYPSESDNLIQCQFGQSGGKLGIKYHSLPDSTTSTKDYFGSRNYPEIYSRIAKPNMEKRRTLERFQKLGFGKRAASTESKPSKAEKLRELTELLKGSRSNSSPSTVPPPVPPPLPPPLPPPVPLRFKKRQRTIESQKSLESVSDVSVVENSEKSETPIDKASLRSNASTSNLDSLEPKLQLMHDTSKSIDSLPDLKLARPESRQIIGSYTQSTIPFRSASFSQSDPPAYKYSRAEDSKKIDKSTDTNRYPEISEVSINVSSDGRLENIEKAVEAIEAEVKQNESELKLKQAAEMTLEPLVEEEAPLTPTSTEFLEQATTCLIPIPVYDSVVKEWSTTSPSEHWVGTENVVSSSPDPTEEPPASLEITEPVLEELPSPSSPETQYPIDISQSPEPVKAPKHRPESLKIDGSVEVPNQELQSPVRKRQSNNDLENSLLSSESEEKRRIDKSKRRKGIYIQWPALEKSAEQEVHIEPKAAWHEISSDVTDVLNDLSKIAILEAAQRKISDCNSMSSDPSTPDVERAKPSFRPSQRTSLAYQSSDEKDDLSEMSTPPLRQFKNLFIRGDSVSDNESDRAPSRDRASASPAPEGDLKRYSKRPLRGPYGQMLEAEMKKPSPKVHYEEILEELTKSDIHLTPTKSRGLSSYSFDESSIPHFLKQKTRKTNAYLPVPTHVRTASSPSQLLEVSASKEPPRSPSSLDSYDVDKVHKKLSLDCHAALEKPKRTSSDTSDKHSKRSSSSASDKSSQRRFDETRCSSRTPSERSFVLHTPETPKGGPVASPELLAELLKGSSEKLATEQHQLNSTTGHGSASGDDLPPGILKHLNVTDADPRIHVVIELYNTEQSYVDSLQTVVNKYLNPLKQPENSGIIDAATVDEIFFMVPSILNIHERFLGELRRRCGVWDASQKIGDAFIEVFSNISILDTYTSFINNWTKAKTAIRVTKSQRPQFARFLEAMCREHKRKLSLDNLLIKPVQKFPHYELIFSRLIKNTDAEHPDHKPLQDALKLVHDILLHLNCKEKEALENGQREATLRELEGVIEGMNDLVTSERSFLLFELVMVPSGQATRKERGFFLFNDLLVVTSIKKRSGTIRKPPVTCPGSVACTLESNKYKYITKIPLDDLEIVKSKDENIRRMMKEIEQLSEDSNKLQQISELSMSLKCSHAALDECIRELQRDIQRQLTDRQSNDSQLSQMDFTINTSNGVQNMSVVFSKPEKRTQWEETISEAKQKLASSVEKHPVPEFINSVPIRKTRAGLQFTCAAPTLGIQKDVWVCNSDGYVGQVCVLSLTPEPTVTSCNGVCNARILCVSSVPANIETRNICISIEDTNVSTVNNSISTATTINTIANNRRSTETNLEKLSTCTPPDSTVTPVQLDSSSSSDESEADAGPPESKRDTQEPIGVVLHQHQDSGSTVNDENEGQQSTMWLGTEDGCIHVYNCTDNIRIKKNKIKIQHISAVYAILYLDNRVFVSLANGDILVYTRDHNGWNTSSPLSISVGTVTSPVTKLLNVHGQLWCAIQGVIKILNTNSLQVENQIQISSDSKPITNLTLLGNCVWISVQNSAHIKCFHSTSFEMIFEVNLAPSVNKMLSNCDDIIRQHKAACLRVTSLLACKDLIWVGTSAGVILTIPAQGININSPIPIVTGIPHGHTGHVRFLTSVDADSLDSKTPSTASSNRNSILNTLTTKKSDSTKTLIISGGDGYEDFRSLANNTMSEVAGREDSTNHLLLWEV